MTATTAPAKLQPKDYASDQEVRWCPGCGDYAILKAVQKVLADIGARRENTVFVSGIGCSSRFPYYVSTYGFHTVHGRAPAVATGVKLANPALDVWVMTGDGDGLSIGGNHMLHVLRRNVDLQIILFNNEIYGLTKGQYSPTSRQGTKSPTSPTGSIERPLSAVSFAPRGRPLRRPGHRYPAGTPRGGAETGSRPSGRVLRGGVPELPRVQRRRLR
jgi:2-oxoglutarate ferredoxin oxidoreductase subunit beta